MADVVYGVVVTMYQKIFQVPLSAKRAALVSDVTAPLMNCWIQCCRGQYPRSYLINFGKNGWYVTTSGIHCFGLQVSLVTNNVG